MTDHQKALLEELLVLDKICRENNIRYTMLGGTMLGAYRHKGFIPWDDDADIGMPREDFERFISLPKESIPAPYVIRHHSLEKNVPYVFAHIENSETVCVEKRRSGRGYKGGIYTEIFPLDEAPESADDREKLGRKIKRLKKILYLLIMPKSRYKNNILKILVVFIARKMYDLDEMTKKIDDLLKNSAGRSRIYGNLLGHWGLRENVTSDVIEPFKQYKFEGCKLYGVSEPNAYLARLYGESFMLPPGEDEIKSMKHDNIILK